MPEFKQIIGRGTRVRDDYGKLWFSILDPNGKRLRVVKYIDYASEAVRSMTSSSELR